MERTKTPVSEYIKIRRHVMTLIYRAGNRAVRIPTLTELAAMFNVSRPTVIKALKELTNDGYIIARPHLGSFTNPAKNIEQQGMDIMPVVGVLHTDGMLTHYTPYFAEQLAYLLLKCAQIPVVVHQIQLSSHRPEQILRSIEAESLDLLVWMQAAEKQKPLIEEMRKRGLKVITSSLPDGSDWNILHDYFQAGYEIGEKCLKRNLRNPLLICNSPEMYEINGFIQAYKEAGIEVSDQNFFPRGDCMENLVKRFSQKEPPDVLFFMTSNYNAFLRKLEVLKPDFRETLTLIFPNVLEPIGCKGFTYLYATKKNAEVITGMIRDLLNPGVSREHKTVIIPIKVRDLQTIKPKKENRE